MQLQKLIKDGYSKQDMAKIMNISRTTLYRHLKEYNLPVVKSPCPVDGSTKRENVKNLIGEINHQYPGAKARMIRAVIDDIVNPDCPPQN